MRQVIATAVTVTLAATVLASAAELPLSDTYGNLLGCLAHQSSSISSDNITILTAKGVEHHEGGCTFGVVKKSDALGKVDLIRAWDTTASCLAEDFQSNRKYMIVEVPHLVATIISATDWVFTDVLPACSLPYDVQVRFENERLNNSGTTGQ